MRRKLIEEAVHLDHTIRFEELTERVLRVVVLDPADRVVFDSACSVEERTDITFRKELEGLIHRFDTGIYFD